MINCAFCNDKQFSAVIESHLPIEEQPVLICYECFITAAEYIDKPTDYDRDIIGDYKQQREILQPGRCHERIRTDS